MSTLLTLQLLKKYNLLEKTKVYLIDVSENVIVATQKCDFFLPESIIDPKLKGKIFKKLRESKTAICSAEKIPWKNNTFHIILAGFLFHHLHDSTKPIVANEIIQVLTPGGIVAIAEEWFKNYEEYAKNHKNDKIPLALESIISFKKLSGLFSELEITYKTGTNHKKNFYAFCAQKIN